LEKVVFGDKIKVNEFDEKVWGHYGEVFDGMVFKVFFEPFFGVLLDGSDRVGSEELCAFEVDFFWSVKLLKVVFHLIEQNERLHGLVKPLDLPKSFKQIPFHPENINEPVANSKLVKVVRCEWEVGFEVLGFRIYFSVYFNTVGEEQLGFLGDCFEAADESFQCQYFGLHEIECFGGGAFVSVDEQSLFEWNR
jgi:hypothetical protein